MKTSLRKLFGASIGGGAPTTLFVVALTGLIAGAPLAARAQGGAVVGTVTFRDKTANSITVVSDVLENTFTLTDPIGTGTTTPEGKFQTGNTMGDATIFSPWYELNATNRRWVATFTASKTVTFTSVTIGGIYAYTANYGGTLSRRPIFTLTVGDVSASSESFATPTSGGERTITFDAPVTLTAGETLTLSCAKASNNSGNFGAGFTSLTFMGPEPTISTETVEWVAEPSLVATSQSAAITVFGLRLDGLRQLGETVPATLPETAALSSVMVEFLRNQSGSANQNVRHLVLTDEAGAVVAVSAEASPTPTAEAADITFAFPLLPTLSLSVPYKGYFVAADDVPEVGANFDTAAGVNTRVALRADAVATAAGNTAGDFAQYCVAAQFTLQAETDEVETAWVMGPPNMGTSAYGKYKEAGICFSAMGGFSADAPTILPTSVDLQALTARWNWSQNDGAVTQVRQAVITDAEHTVVAASDVLPAPPAQNDALTMFDFSAPVTLDVAAQYLVYFVNEANADVAVGETFAHETEALEVRLTIYSDAETAGKGFYVTGSSGYVPAFFIELASSSVPEQPLGALNINFDTDASRLDAETLYGLDGVQYPGSQWNTLTTAPGRNTVSGQSVTDTEGHTLTVSYYGNSFEDYGDSYAPLLHTILMDGGGGAGLNPNVQIETIPYETYDVYIYMNSNSPGEGNASVRVNDEAYYYIMEAGQDSATQVEAAARWAQNGDMTQVALGTTVMRIANLSGRTLKVEAMHTAGGRGNIAAVQVVELRTEPEPTHWEGTINADVAASALMVSNGTSQKALSALTEADSVELAFTETFTLTVDAPVTVDTLTLTGAEGAMLVTSGASITAAEIAIEGGTVRTAEGTFVSEAPINLAEGTTLQIQGADGASFTQAVTGAGAVEIYTGSDVTVEADFTHTGGTTVASAATGVATTLRYAGQPLGEGPVTVGPGGIFDLCGLACGQDISLTGGTLANTGAPAVTPQVASVNFNADGQRGNPEPGAAAQVGAAETAGLVEVLGEHWTASTGGVGAVAPKFVDDANRTASGAAAASIEGLSVAWDVGSDTGLWSYAGNAASYLKGYLDDTTNGDAFTRSITLTVPAAVAKAGYDVYLYFASDSVAEGDFNKFSPVSVRAGEGAAATVYSYVNGALTPVATAGRDTGWGDVKAGLNTVAEGINVMVLRHRTEATLQIGIHGYGSANKPSDGPRGSIAALQIKTGTGAETPAYSGTLTVNGADNTLDAAADTVFSGTFVGTGTLTKAGDATLTLTGATTVDAAAMTLKASAGALTFGAGNTLPGLTLNLGVAASVEEDVTALTLGALAGSGGLALNDCSTLTLAGAAAEASYTGALSTDGALSLVKQGANTQRLENLAGINALAVVAEGGTLALGSGVNALTRLETAGGNVTALPATVAYAEMAAGNAAAASAATASAARPAAVAQGDVTVTDFTLQDGGEIRYETADDLEKFLPKGFLVAGRTYKVVLAQTLADTLAFPCSFKVQGASGVTLEPYRVAADGTLEKIEAGVVVSGNTLYLNSAAAILGDLSTLPAASHRYPFDGSADDAATGGVNLTNDGTMTYAASDNGQALSGGTPYSNGVSPNPSGEEWTAGLFLNTASAPRNAVLAHFGVGGGNGAPGAGSVVLATGAEPGTLSVWWHDGTDYRNVLTAGLGLGGDAAWHHLLLTHSAQGFRLYVDGEEAAVAPGAYASRPGRLRIGKALGGAISGLVDGAGWFLLDDLATWPTVLREGQITLAMAEVAGKWRWNEAATPAELFAAAAQWTAADGIAAAWPTENADTYTARATLTLKGTADDLFTALQGFTARTVLLQGEPLTLAVTDTAVDFPDTAGTVVVDNDLTLDLSGMGYDFFAQAFSENGVRLVGGVWNGALSLRGTPEGFDFSLDARADGLYLLGTVGAVVPDAVASINFRSNAGSIATGETGGLVPMLGQYWVINDDSASGTATFGLYDLNAATVADSTPTGDSISVTWATGGTWTDTSNTTSYLKGYLDDNGNPSTLTLTVPEAVAQAGYDVYLYSSVDATGGSAFSAREVTGDDGTMVSYSYVSGVLTAGSTAGWGNPANGRNTVAEGVNVMRLPARTDRSLKIDFRNRNGRGGLAAIQVVSYRPRDIYTRDVADGDTWTEAGAWVNANDATDTVDAPTGEDVKALVGLSGDTTLNMGDLTQLTLNAIETYGDGILTLTFDGDAVAAAIDDVALPEGETYALVNATLDSDKVRVRVTPTTDGSVVAVSLTATGATATAIAPMGTVYRATVTGAATWDSITWEPTGTPTASDTAILTLTGDADLAGSASVGMMQVYADGHALSRANTIGAASWHFFEEAILALKEDQPLPATIATNPKRVRYDYTYEQNYTSTTAYETEFTAGFNASLDLAAGGLVEFSAGTVTVGTINPSNGPTVSTLIFSGTANLTMTGDQNANGLKIANGTVTFRDNARATLSRIHMRCLNASDGTLIVEGNASLSVTGSSNIDSNTNALQLGDYGGLATLILRDNATFRATNGAMLLLCNNQSGTMSQHRTTLTIEDNAKMYLAGISRARSSEGIINLNGGTLFLGNRGFYSFNNSTAPITLNFNGGTLGVWQDWTWGEAVTAACQTVTGDPTLEVAEGVTLTLEAGANLLPADGNATVRGAGAVKSALATLPALRLEDGLFAVTADAQTPGLELAGGALRLEARLTAGDFAARVPSRVAFLLGGESDAYLSAGEGRVPDLSRVTAVLTLDPDRQAGTLIPYEAPLYLGACDPAATPSIAGFMVENNVGNAIGTQTPVYVAGAQGLGLYARLTGNEVTKPHTLALTDPTTGDSVTQSVADTYGYWIFDGQVDGARLLLPSGTLNFREAVFRGQPMTLVASGDEPHLLLQAKALTLNATLTLDLTGWEAALRDFVDGAVDNLPCSLCLIAAESLAGEGMVILAFPDALPEAYKNALSLVPTDRGVYLVARAAGARPAQALSVNFADRATALAAPPAAPGAYAVPVAAWNTLAGSFFSADLRVSDLAGVASIPAVGTNGQNTQLSATAAAVVADSDAPATLIKTWLTDDAAQTVRVANIPFAKYRLALILASDYTAAAAYAPVTVGSDVYAMDAEGYTRKNVLAYAKTGALGDTAWGSTARDGLSAENPDVLGLNTLVTDVLEGSAVDIALPRLVYGRTYAGLAALQIIEAPEPEADAGEGTAYAYTFNTGDTELNLAGLDLTTADGTAKWQSGPENTLALTVPEGVSATLTLPLNFQADRIVAAGDGSLTLQVEQGGGAALAALDASALADLTVHFPCVGVAFSPATGLNRFEAAFDNDGQAYTIAEGSTLSLGADSGIAVSLNGTLDRTGATTTLAVNLTSPGTLRRDYPMSIPSLPNGTNGAETDMTMAFKAGTASGDPVNLRANLLVEDGDVLRVPNKYHFSGASLVYTQTGGLATFESANATEGGFLLLANASPDNATAVVSLGGRNGARLETPVVWSWRGNAHVDLDVSGDATLAVGNMGLRAYNATARLEATFSEDGTLELTDTTLGTGGSGTVATTFNGGRIASVQGEATLSLPVTFAGTAETPTTIDPGTYGTLVLNAANTAESTAAIAVPRGTLALANASGLGEATVTIADGAAFEARGFSGAEGSADEVTGKVVFADGSQCRVTTTEAEPELPYIARIAGSIGFSPFSGKDAARFFLNGEEFAVANVEVNEAAGTVTFGGEGGALVPDAVTWDTANVSGTWQDGVAGPWQGGATFINGAAVTFPDVTQPTEATVAGSVKPGTVTFGAGATTAYYTFAGAEDAVLDLSGQARTEGSTQGRGYYVQMGAGTTFDVPVRTQDATTGLLVPNGAVRLMGVLSDNNRTATLLGTGDVNSAAHGVWFDGSANLTLSPHAGETQTLSAAGQHMAGSGTVTVAGQVAGDGSVSGGTVRFGGNVSGTNWNARFSGDFAVRDGATLDFAMTRANTGSNGDQAPYFRNGDTAPLYENGTVGFRLTNGGVLRFSGCRGVIAGQTQRGRAETLAGQPVEVGYGSRLEYALSEDRQQMTPYGTRFNGDGATLLIGAAQATAANRGLFVPGGVTFTVPGATGDEEGAYEAGSLDPADPKVESFQDAEGVTRFRLTAGIAARIEAADGTAPLRAVSSGLSDEDYAAVTLDVGADSALEVAAPLASESAVPFRKVGPGRLELTWPTIGNVVEVEVEEGALGGDAELTSGTVTVAADATVEAGLSVTELALESGATLALDPTGARQLRAGTVTFAAGGRYVISALSAPPTPAAGREPVKILSWSNVVDVSAAGFLVDDSLTQAGYGVEIRADGLYLAPAATYVRVLGTVVEDKDYALNWFDRAWHRADDFSTLVDYAPAANETANVVFIVPDSASSVGLRVTLDREVSFATVRFARGKYDADGKLIGIGEQCGGTVDYVYDLTRAEMPSERETRTYAFLPTLAYRIANGDVASAQLDQVLVPDGYEAEIDGVTATVYLGSGGETGAINVSFTGGSEGSLSWIGTDTAPCGAVPFAGVYWNNASTQGGAGLESLPLATDAYKGYELKPRVSGAQAASATPTVRYAFTAGRTVAGRAGLAAGFLPGPGQEANPGALGFIEDSGIGSAGWAVRVDDIPFARYDLYLLFAGSGDGAATYPAVRVKPGTGAWRTYAFRNGWAAPAGSGDAWDGQAALDEGFADGVNLMHLRVEGGGSLQIVPHDGANGNNANVGLAALQIVEIPQGQPAYYKAAGPTWSGQTWSYAANAGTGATQNVPAAAWQDATPDAPHYALLDGLTRLDADRAAALPFLRRTGSGSLELTGTAGTLSAGTLDLLEASGTVTVHEDLFVQAPNVILGDAVTLVPFPNAAADASLAWRWVYPDDVAHTATLSKKGPYGLTLTQPVVNRLQIDAGTLWLTQAANADNYPGDITGDGTLGWAGTGTLRVAFNNLPDGSADADGVFLRVASGTVTLDAVADSSLPANGTVLIEDGGSLTFYRTAQGRTFQNGTFLARNGGCLLYEAGSKASNLFANGNEQRSQLPSVRLESGLFRQTLGADHDNGTGGSVHDVFGLTSSGLSRHYIDNAGNKCWAHKALNIHGGRIQVLDGTLALHSSLADGAASRHSVVLLPNASTTDTYGDTGSTGYLDVASGATLLSAYPIYAGNNANGTLVKVGGGIWVQAKNICQSVGYNGGDANLDQGGQDPYCNVEVRAGTLRLNGPNTFAQPSTAQSRTVTVGNGARLDGAGDFDQYFNVTIGQGATLAAGFPADAEWATAADGWYGTWFNDFPARFKAPTTEATAITFNGGLEFEDGAVLEVDLAKAVASTNTLVRVSGESARVSLGSSLTVRLKNLQTAFDGPVRLTAFTVNPSREPTINCPEAIALDGDVRWLTDAEALGDETANGTIHNLWLVATGDSYVWTAQSGNWSDARWTHQGETTNIVNGITAPEAAPKARVVADSADVALTVNQDPGEPNQPDWGLHGLVLSAAQGGSTLTLAQGGTLGGTADAPTGALNGLSIGASLWKVGPGTARVDALAWLDNAATLTVNEGSLTFTRPLLRDNLSAGQGVNPLGAALSVAEDSTLTFAFAEPTDPERGYFAGLGLENPQALTLNGSFSGAGTLRVEGEGTAVTLASQSNSVTRQDGALSYSVGKGARLTLQGDTPASTGDATPRTVTVEGTLDLASERALGATTAWTWELADGALVTTADDARIRGTVRLDAGAATLGRDSQQWDGDLSVTVGEGATLTFAGNIQTPEDAPASATFAKRGAGTAVIDDAGYFSPGLHVDVAEGTLRVEGTLSVTPGERGVTPAWTVRGGATLALGGGTCSFSDGSLTVEAGGVLDCADGAITLNTGVDRPALLEDGATLRFGSGTGLNEQAGLTIPTGLRVEGRVAVEVAVDNPAGLRLSEYPLIAFGNSARQGTGTFVLGGANVTALSAAGWTLEDRGADGVYLVAFGNGQNYVWAGTAAGWLDGDAWVYNGASTPTTWVDGTSQGAVSFLDVRPSDGMEVPGEYRTVGSTGTQQVTALRSENSGGDYALEGSGGLTVQGLLLKVGTSGLTFRRPVTFGNGGAINVQEGTVTFADTLGSTDNPAALLAPVTLGQGAKLAFSGNKARTLSGDFDAAEGSTVAVSGGALTLAGDVTGLGSLRAEGQGTNVALTAPGQALALGGADAPTFALGTGATLTLGGDLPGGDTVAPKFDAATQGATLRWEGVASVESGSVPRLGALGGAVSTLVYAPRAGHLILDPGSLMDGAALSLENDGAETTALWLGAGDGTVEEAIRLSALTASGAACVGVEPKRAPVGGAAWAGERTLTLALSGDAAFGGTFMGAADAQGDIRAGLTLEKAPDAAGTPTFTYSGESTAGTVGTLTAKGVRVSVTGEWAGAATAEDGGVLGGSGTLGDVTLGAGARLSANAADVRGELAPATLTLGSLELGAGAGLEVLARVDEASGATELSLVQVAGTCRLGANDLALNVYLDLEEGAAVNTRKILGWDTLDGYQSVSATVYVRGADGAWQESGDYFVRRGDDGLYLHRASARFWMILR